MSSNQQALLMAGSSADPPLACIPDPYYGPFSRTITFQETFSSGITDYTTVSGNRSLFTVASDTYGDTLTVAAQNVGTIATINRAISGGPMDRLTFYFQIVASNADDAATVSIGGYTFNPRRESSFDASRRPYMNGVVVAASALTVGDWYFADMRVQGAALILTLTNISTSSSVTTTLSAVASAPPGIATLQFTADAGGLTCPTKYAQVTVYTDNPHTALMLRGETLTDTSSDVKTVTVTGAVTSSTTKKPYGSASLYFNGSGGRLQITNSDEFNFWSGNFTIRMKILFDVVGAVTYSIVGKRTGVNFGQFSIVYSSGQILARFDSNTGDAGWLVSLAGSQTILANTWYDYEVVRSGGSFQHRLDGILVDSTSITPTTSLANQAVDIWIGANSDGTSGLNGYIKDLQITKGVARNTTNFTPPMMTWCAGSAIYAVGGTDALTGQQVATAQGSMRVLNPWVKLSGQVTTTAAGIVGAVQPNVSVSIVGQSIGIVGAAVVPLTANRAAALTGQGVVTSRGSIGVAPYPDLFKEAITLSATEFNPAATITVKTDGTVVVARDGVGFVSIAWLDTTAYYTPVQVSGQYQIVSITLFDGELFSTVGLPFVLNTDATVVTAGGAELQINFAPTANNPRYGESGYWGYSRILVPG